MGSEGLGRALNGTCALSGPARAIAAAATVVTALLGSRRCHRESREVHIHEPPGQKPQVLSKI